WRDRVSPTIGHIKDRTKTKATQGITMNKGNTAQKSVIGSALFLNNRGRPAFSRGRLLSPFRQLTNGDGLLPLTVPPVAGNKVRRSSVGALQLFNWVQCWKLQSL